MTIARVYKTRDSHVITSVPSSIRLARVLIAFAIAAVSSGCIDSARTADSTLPAPRTTANATNAVDEGYSVYELPGSWRDQKGDTLQLAALAGRVQVVAMVYTNCHTTCPLIISEMKRIEAALSESQRSSVGFVLVSLDPSRDTPAQLAAWATGMGLNPATWTLLSGTEGAVRELAAALNVRYQPQQNGELAHTNGLTVLDRRGNLNHQQLGLGESIASIGAMKALLQ